jgi:hypothetical protein
VEALPKGSISIDWIIIDVGEKVVTARSGFKRVFAWEPLQSRMIVTGTVEVKAGGVVLTARVLERTGV